MAHALTWEPYFLTLMLINFALSAYIYLVTWRIARRFGWRGLAVVVIALAIIGPPRDYAFMAKYPEWGAYAPGRTVLAVAANYVLLVLVGHGVMRLVAGPAGADQLRVASGSPPDLAPQGTRLATFFFQLTGPLFRAMTWT